MAIVVELRVPRASQADAERLDDSVVETFADNGGPPAGLMMHLARPEGDGILLVDVWRNESEWRSFFDDVFLPRLTAEGLTHEGPVVRPVWCFARP